MAVHYEIFRRQGRSGWAMVEAVDERQTALTKAQELLDGGAAAVKVVKETLQSSGDYMALTIFEEIKPGAKPEKKKGKGDDAVEQPLPCFKPDDLYSYHARMTMSRLLGDWLARQKMTVTELTHSAQALEKFEATGTTYQHAIQKIAVAEAADSEVPVSQIVKTLNDLCTAAIHRVYKDDKRGVFPIVAAGGFGPLALKLVGKPDARYVLNGAVVKYLGGSPNWNEKLKRLLALMPEIAVDGPERVLLLGAVDGLVAEMLTGAAALTDLLGHNDNLGQALFNLTELFLGTRVASENASEGVNELARYFAKDDLPEARIAIAGRILSELKGMKRLCPSSMEDELKTLRKLANHLVRGQGKYLGHEELISAFTERSKRLVTHEPLGQFLAEIKTADDKIERLLLVEENIIGAENKRSLMTFIMPIATHNTFDDQVCGPTAQPLQRLKRLTELQTRVLRTGFQDLQKTQLSDALDAAATRIESRAGVLKGLETRVANPVERPRRS